MRAVLCLLLLVGCNKKDRIEGASPDWGDDKRAVGACMGTAATGATVPEGVTTICYEKQSEADCVARMNYLYVEHATCASRGFKEQCPNAEPTARFQSCTATAQTEASSETLDAAKEVLAIYDEAAAAADADCAAFGAKLAPLRTRLEAIGQAHPGVLKQLSAEQLQALDAIAHQEALSTHLRACKDPEVLQFSYAMTKVM